MRLPRWLRRSKGQVEGDDSARVLLRILLNEANLRCMVAELQHEVFAHGGIVPHPIRIVVDGDILTRPPRRAADGNT